MNGKQWRKIEALGRRLVRKARPRLPRKAGVAPRAAVRPRIGGAASTHVLAALTAREARPFRARCCFALAPVVLRAGRAPRRSASGDRVGTWRWAGKQGRVPGCEEPPRGRSPREKPRVCPERTWYWGERIKRSRQGNRDELVRGVPGKRRGPISEAPGVDAWKTPP